MANITRTFLFPVPTEWMGQDQDDDNVGVATYNGPDRIKCWYMLDGDGNKTSTFFDARSADEQNLPTPPVDTYEVILNAETHPLHAAIIFGGVAEPDFIEVAAGPSDEPNPSIESPDLSLSIGILLLMVAMVPGAPQSSLIALVVMATPMKMIAPLVGTG
jgi:hypothetical protein